MAAFALIGRRALVATTYGAQAEGEKRAALSDSRVLASRSFTTADRLTRYPLDLAANSRAAVSTSSFNPAGLDGAGAVLGGAWLGDALGVVDGPVGPKSGPTGSPLPLGVVFGPGSEQAAAVSAMPTAHATAAAVRQPLRPRPCWCC
ncbi:hypothetical protein DWB68_09570 [Galactobacter valiniphilus]|uniref:Uncharacterized protein n=1 Tax=Galactobacter valiniphilus TaxID=2676122 RepID=A0A399JAD3_9MICC|nr:hypothetical protein DWB68_09570 [Galactobacter valiniphilus]